MDSNCKKRKRDIQRRTMHFLRHLDPAFEKKSAVLLATSKIPSLKEAISAMIQEESRIGLQAGTGGLPGVKLALAASNLGNVGSRVETRECYNCGEVGHLKTACTKPLRERNSGGRGQSGGRGRGRRGRRGGGRGGYRTNLTVAEEGDKEGVVDVGLSDEDQAQALLDACSQLLKKKGKGVIDGVSTSFSSRGNIVSFAHSATGTCNTQALASISTTRSPKWIIDSGASRHVTGAAREFSSYTHLAVSENIQTADGTA